MADGAPLLSRPGPSYSNQALGYHAPNPSNELPIPAGETSVPLLVHQTVFISHLIVSHVFITVNLNTSLPALEAQVREAFRHKDVNNGSGILGDHNILELRIAWQVYNQGGSHFPHTTVFTDVNIASLLFFLRRRASVDVVEVVMGRRSVVDQIRMK
ncbi:MAG: hypothetical protein FRX48_03498 [Lasallia pustulata]|uniref:Uncharacterized protein n=1 Tax=Lasallia pustulata TaxID=136370 RepID=A0A5M8PU09_9LECA|nr:MAG: hypothetical protein FRX48_03498 [Lasallia pustulata]